MQFSPGLTQSHTRIVIPTIGTWKSCVLYCLFIIKLAEISVFFKDCLHQSGAVNWSPDNRRSTVHTFEDAYSSLQCYEHVPWPSKWVPVQINTPLLSWLSQWTLLLRQCRSYKSCCWTYSLLGVSTQHDAVWISLQWKLLILCVSGGLELVFSINVSTRQFEQGAFKLIFFLEYTFWITALCLGSAGLCRYCAGMYKAW
jgi:hypothetical protein